MTQPALPEGQGHVDVLIVGGGINGAGIARDAAGRGLSVALVEQGDLASATSSASSKLVHGGLRYLEHGEFRLVAEALRERELLLRAAPHLVRPMRFVLPQAPGQRSAWMIRAGLLAYDWLARRQTLAPSKAVSLCEPPYSSGLKSDCSRGYVYSDCRVDDARLVIANARSAADAGASILPRTRCVGAERRGEVWRVRLRADNGDSELTARALVNAAGPWAAGMLELAGVRRRGIRLRLVQGSHIVVPRLYAGDHAFILQNDDGRVIFVYAYEGHTLIGTTDVETGEDPGRCGITPYETDYLCRAANRYFEREIRATDVLWSFCGVRPLVDDGSPSASRITRDYLLDLDGAPHEPPLLSAFGGKITTYRALAERALDKLAPWFPGAAAPWTAAAPLPGGDLPEGVDCYFERLRSRYPDLPADLLRVLSARHGTSTVEVLGDISRLEDLGEHFGAQLYAREVDHFRLREWAHDADDVLWRRTKAGLHLTPAQRARVTQYMDRLKRPSTASSSPF